VGLTQNLILTGDVTKNVAFRCLKRFRSLLRLSLFMLKGEVSFKGDSKTNIEALNDGCLRVMRTAILSFWNNDPYDALTRTNIIGYSRKWCGDYMQLLFS
jgi:hypothetical protein